VSDQAPSLLLLRVPEKFLGYLFLAPRRTDDGISDVFDAGVVDEVDDVTVLSIPPAAVLAQHWAAWGMEVCGGVEGMPPAALLNSASTACKLGQTFPTKKGYERDKLIDSLGPFFPASKNVRKWMDGDQNPVASSFTPFHIYSLNATKAALSTVVYF
jgi:hypothetical protein